MNPKDLVGAKKAPTRYVPKALVLETAAVMETGAAKYGPFNWRQQPVSAQTYGEAIERHLAAWMEGQDNAEDSGLSHIAHIAASCGIILDAAANGTLLDDRVTGPAAAILRRLDKTAVVVDQGVADPTETEEWAPAIKSEPWGEGDGPVYGMVRSEWDAHGRTIVQETPHDRARQPDDGADAVVRRSQADRHHRFLCGHVVGEEPTERCGTAIHWSRVNGIDLKNPPLELDCNCKTDWPDHSFDCPLFHLTR